MSPGECFCYDGFQGRNCSAVATNQGNLLVVFHGTPYNCTVSEEAKIGTLLVVINATFGGHGERVSYVLDPFGAEIDVTDHLVIDSASGHVSLLSPISRNLLPNGTLVVNVTALVSGVPPKENTTSLTINVIDENDHCPVFHGPDAESVHTVNASAAVNTTVVVVTATDDDFNDNGRVSFSFGVNTDNVVRDNFEIDVTSGRILSRLPELTIDTFHVDVLATDAGVNPCSTRMSIIIQVLPPDVAPLTTPPTTTVASTTTTTTTATTTTVSLSSESTVTDVTSLLSTTGTETMAIGETTGTSTASDGASPETEVKTTTTGISPPSPQPVTTAATTTSTTTNQGKTTSTHARMQDPQGDTSTDDSAGSKFVLLASLSAVAAFIAVSVITVLAVQLATKKTPRPQSSARVQPSWHSRFTDRASRLRGRIH